MSRKNATQMTTIERSQKEREKKLDQVLELLANIVTHHEGQPIDPSSKFHSTEDENGMLEEGNAICSNSETDQFPMLDKKLTSMSQFLHFEEVFHYVLIKLYTYKMYVY